MFEEYLSIFALRIYCCVYVYSQSSKNLLYNLTSFSKNHRPSSLITHLQCMLILSCIAHTKLVQHDVARNPYSVRNRRRQSVLKFTDHLVAQPYCVSLELATNAVKANMESIIIRKLASATSFYVKSHVIPFAGGLT